MKIQDKFKCGMPEEWCFRRDTALDRVIGEQLSSSIGENYFMQIIFAH